MPRSFQFCPYCAHKLVLGMVDDTHRLLCEASCGYVCWNNPLTVVAVRIKVAHKFVLVQRGVLPFIGKWCMPCGFVNEFEGPAEAAVRETFEESHLIVTVPELPFKIVNLAAVNQNLMFFEGTVVGGILEKGSDAIAAGTSGLDALPEIAFSTHSEVLLAA